ncbi:MAG: hypothetical protein J5654_08070 [Victivallales bacterium]|nr:hypothetical protein [Victivallales bacterium]
MFSTLPILYGSRRWPRGDDPAPEEHSLPTRQEVCAEDGRSQPVSPTPSSPPPQADDHEPPPGRPPAS